LQSAPLPAIQQLPGVGPFEEQPKFTVFPEGFVVGAQQLAVPPAVPVHVREEQVVEGAEDFEGNIDTEGFKDTEGEEDFEGGDDCEGN
jgi:hypothetical protein